MQHVLLLKLLHSTPTTSTFPSLQNDNWNGKFQLTERKQVHNLSGISSNSDPDEALSLLPSCLKTVKREPGLVKASMRLLPLLPLLRSTLSWGLDWTELLESFTLPLIPI